MGSLFKTGAAVDLQIATDPQAPADRKAPVAGDKRLLMTELNGKPIAVLYNAVVPGTPPDKVWQAISPVAKNFIRPSHAIDRHPLGHEDQRRRLRGRGCDSVGRTRLEIET